MLDQVHFCCRSLCWKLTKYDVDIWWLTVLVYEIFERHSYIVYVVILCFSWVFMWVYVTATTGGDELQVSELTSVVVACADCEWISSASVAAGRRASCVVLRPTTPASFRPLQLRTLLTRFYGNRSRRTVTLRTVLAASTSSVANVN